MQIRSHILTGQLTCYIKMSHTKVYHLSPGHLPSTLPSPASVKCVPYRAMPTYLLTKLLKYAYAINQLAGGQNCCF